MFDRHQSYDRVECHIVQIYPAVFTHRASIFLLLFFFINRLRIVAVFLLFYFCSFAKIRWVYKSHIEQSLGKHKNGRVKSKYSLGTGEAKFPLGKGKQSTGSGSSGSVTEVITPASARQESNMTSAEGEPSGNTALLKAIAQDLKLKEKTGPVIEGGLTEVVNALTSRIR